MTAQQVPLVYFRYDFGASCLTAEGNTAHAFMGQHHTVPEGDVQPKRVKMVFVRLKKWPQIMARMLFRSTICMICSTTPF
jgi:hypothetical protein